MTSRRLLALGAIATLAVGAAACSPDDAEETPTAAPTTASESPSASAEETTAAEPSTPSIPPPDPADYPGKDEHTEEGAKQAVRYYWATLIWAYQSGDASALEALFDESCGNCIENVNEIKEGSAGGALWSGAEISNEESATSEPGKYEVVVQYNFTLSAHEEPDVESGETESVPEARYLTATGLNWESGEWVVGGVNFETEYPGQESS